MRKVFLLVLIGFLLAVGFHKPQKEVLVVESKPAVSHVEAPQTAFDKKLYSLTNKARIDAGKTPLRWSEKLHQSALIKCQDMLTKGYWSHNSPTQSWVDFLPKGFFSAGENLARNTKTPEHTEAMFMNSPEHKSNILGVYNKFGSAECGNLVVEHFELTDML
jgi:uncharacterized protein YkwD